MATNKVEFVFDWGDHVVVAPDAPNNFNPGKAGYICGRGTIDSTVLSKELDQEIGTPIYTVEFENGSSMLIPDKFLTKI